MKWIKKIDIAKSINEKLFCISNAYNTMNNTIKFNSEEKNEVPAQEELARIFQYIIIKAEPKRMFSNIYYIKTFLDDEDIKNKKKGFFLSKLSLAIKLILNLNNQHLNISEEEFIKKNNETITKLLNK